MQHWNIGIIQAGLSRSKRFYPTQVLKAAAPPFNNTPGHAIPPPMGLLAAIAARRFDGASPPHGPEACTGHQRLAALAERR
jgi:hypothetical protein